MSTDRPSYIGIDVGTSGVRAILISASGSVLAQGRRALPATRDENGMKTQQPDDWWNAVMDCLGQLGATQDLGNVAGLSVDGTSGTILLTDDGNRPLGPALMYSDTRPVQSATDLRAAVPAAADFCAPGSALLKAYWLKDHISPASRYYVQQQADWILSRLRGAPGTSDWNNALKLGFDLDALQWPGWMEELDWPASALPEVLRPGAPAGTIDAGVSAATDLPPDVQLHAGTTDGVAAFLASGASQPGDAVTSLGSTLILKLCSTRPVMSRQHGVYSHRLDENRWLAGGASNSGGAVLRQYFTSEELESLSRTMSPQTDTGLDYYPLPAAGERFPYNDPSKKPVLEPKPEDSCRFLQGMFEGIARIEKRGYDLLEELGANPVASIRTTGGGAQNAAWTAIRVRIVGRRMLPGLHEEAAYGAARLAAGLT